MNIKPYFLFLIVAALAGCERWIDPDVNLDPNQPADAAIGTILPFLEADIAYRVVGGNEILRTHAIWLQQLDGVTRQSLAETNYIMDPSSLILIWDNSYAQMLTDARVISEKAATSGSPHNHGVANVLTAVILGQLTDSWGDIPWSEALQAETILQPLFDTQESIYEVIQQKLSEAIDSLSVPNDQTGIKGDYLYDGDTQKWIKAAHALKARYFIHLTKRMGEKAYRDALAEIPLALADNAEDMQFNFGTGETESNPVYQFMREWTDIRMGAFLIDLLKSAQDPRLAVYASPDGNGNYTGSVPGSANTEASFPGVAVAAPDAPTYFITYTEVLFMQAEAILQTAGDLAETRQALIQAVSASLLKNNVLDTGWLSVFQTMIEQMDKEELLAAVMTQKYIATFMQPEAFHSWRRTGIPVLTPNPYGATSEIPRRFPYPSTEEIYNQNTPSGVTITDRVWWDR